jgi:hypothetical protein
MKLLLIAALATLPMAQQKCKKTSAASTSCYKGRLEIKGICSNYTIKLLEGNLDTSKVVASWTNESTKKSYTNVFALGSPCTFPSTLNAGDEFYFVLDDSKQECAVCMAYYPKPEKALSIKVLDKPCN